MIKQLAVLSRKTRALAALALLAGAWSVVPGTAAAQGLDAWEAWSTEQFTLEARESFQFRVTFDQMQVRSWKLVVDGQGKRCDLSVLRVRGESLLYYQTAESRHEVVVPWGKDEEVIVVLTNRTDHATFTVKLLGPPRGQVHAAYSYHVNRALEAFAAGRRLDAEEECERALRQDQDDTVAMVLLAGFLRDRYFYSRASTLVEQALGGNLPAEMRGLAEDLRTELESLRAPLPPDVRKAVERIEKILDRGKGADVLADCQALIDGHPELNNQAKSSLHLLLGRALDQAGRDFEAIDVFTRALGLSRNRAEDAVIYYHMGRLYRDMENLQQARGAFTIALQYGLPGGLDLQAREALQGIEKRLATEN